MAGYRRRTKAGRTYWELTWRENGKTKTASLGPIDQLRESEVRTIARTKGRELVLADHTTLIPRQSFSDFAQEYLEWHAAEYPASHWRVESIFTLHLLSHFTGTLDDVSQLDVERFKSDRLRVVAPGTVAKELRTLSAMLTRAVDLGILHRNPCRLVKAPKSLESHGIRFYTESEMEAIYRASVEGWHKFAWMLYAGTGARRMEGLNLRWKDVGKEALRLISTGEERTKSGLSREIPLSIGAQEALEYLRTWKGKSDLHVLPRIAPESLSRRAIKCIARAGLTGSLHRFRHTFITRLAMNPGIPIHVIKEWAGHSSISVTENYMHFRPSATDEILKGTRI